MPALVPDYLARARGAPDVGTGAGAAPFADGRTGEQQVQGRQVRQDLVLADVGVLRPGRIRRHRAGAPVPAPVRRPAVRPRRFHPPSAQAAGQQPGQQIPAQHGASCGAGPRAALTAWAVMKSASLTSAGCAACAEMTHPSGRFQRCTLVCPRVTLPGSASSVSVRCRFHTCRPVYRGFDKIVVTVPSVHPAAVRCGFLAGSAADGHGTPASFKARAIHATECPASRWANIHRTTCAVAGSGSSRCARRPHAACALFGCGPASASRYPYGGRPPRYRP
jgi:hypothetical protein